jgi:hypothetical protein
LLYIYVEDASICNNLSFECVIDSSDSAVLVDTLP